jgi:ubiquinone/menaquinone biosynthesis C-methylase UbiE
VSDPTKRFSDRVDNYIKYRPGYPDEIYGYLSETIALDKNMIIADIGSGTGISSELFLKHGNLVYGVEPNKEMRGAAEKLLVRYNSFISVDGMAEATTLNDKSVDILTAGQAFHWFDIEKSGLEFKRILKPESYVVLIWNERRSGGSEFLDGYDKLLKEYSNDYEKVKHRNIDEKVFDNFYNNGYKLNEFPNSQSFDFEGLKGRALSSSYMPVKGDKKYEQMIRQLKFVFDKYNNKGRVEFVYDVKLYYGVL